MCSLWQFRLGFEACLIQVISKIPLLQIVNSTYTWPENINSECDLLSVFTSDPFVHKTSFGIVKFQSFASSAFTEQ